MHVNKKTISYNNKKIIIYNQLFDTRENLHIYNLIVNSNFQRTNVDVPFYSNTDRDVKWISYINPTSEISEIINSKYTKCINDFLWSEISIIDQYINYGNNSTVDFIHCDNYNLLSKNNNYTILHFANHTWNPNWHGNLLFFNDECTEIIQGIVPTPGKVVIFDANLNHSATPCNIKAEYPRYTIATKILYPILE